jgi:hypothetical protein
MMRGTKFLIAALTLGLAGSAVAAPSPVPPPPPAAGNYAAYSYVVSNTNTIRVGGCPGAAAGAYYNGQFMYPGPSLTGAVLYNFGLDAAHGFVQQVNFTPATPASGVTTWSGAGTMENSPSGPGTTVAFTFTVTFKFFTAESFEATIAYTVPGTRFGTCTQTNHVLFVQTN